MLEESKAYSGFSVDDLDAAREFYARKLGLEVGEGAMGLVLKIPGSNGVFVYPKEDHLPATYTILIFPVDDVDSAVDELVANGVVFQHYEGVTDSKGVARGIAASRGPDIAWFTAPAGNILSVLHEA